MARRKKAAPRNYEDFSPCPILDFEDDHGGDPLFTNHFCTEREAFGLLWKEMGSEEPPTGEDLEEFFLEISDGIHIQKSRHW